MKQKPEIRRMTRTGVVRAMTCIINEETIYSADCRKKGCPYAGLDCMMAILPDARYLLTNAAADKTRPRKGKPNP